MKLNRLAAALREFVALGVIVNPFPSTITDGQAVDAVPVMANFNWLLSQINANVPALIPSLGAMTAFTPTIFFGGANVGMTFSAQNGQYVRIGNVVFFSAEVSLTAKGASVGAATLGGLPFTISNGLLSSFYPVTVTSFLVDYSIGGVAGGPAIPKGQLVPNTTTISLGTSLINAASGFGQYSWSDVLFAATSAVRVSGFYFA